MQPMHFFTIIVFIVLALIVFSVIKRSFVWIRPYQRGLHERFGKFKGALDPGFYYIPIILPYIDRVTLMDLRETYIDIPPSKVITRDNVVLEVDAIVFYQIVDPAKAFYEITYVSTAIANLAEPGLRNIIGTLSVDEALSSREVINTKLREELDRYSDKWGTRVTKVEVKRIDPPNDIQEAMHRQKTAEQSKRAVILQAEGDRSAAITVAEGRKQATILDSEGVMTAKMRVADGDKYSQIAVAEGRASAVIKVLEGIHTGKVSSEIISYLYVTEALPKIFESQSNKWIMNFDLQKLLGEFKALTPEKISNIIEKTK